MRFLLALGLLAARSASQPPPPPVPAHITTMTAYGYNASAQAGWSTWGKSFNLSALIEGHAKHGLPGMYRIVRWHPSRRFAPLRGLTPAGCPQDCVGCQVMETGGGNDHGKPFPKDPGFAAGVICDYRSNGTAPDKNCTTCPRVYRMCSKAQGDATDWDTQTLSLLGLAKPHLVSGALRGVFLGAQIRCPEGFALS